jgi:hypothetical protein
MPEKTKTMHQTRKQTRRALKLNSIGPSHNKIAIFTKTIIFNTKISEVDG